MTSAKTQPEAEAVSSAYHLALTRLGAQTVQDALQLWQHVPAEHTSEVSAAWLRLAVPLVMRRRSQARALAVAYYRLTRALRTGRTIADPQRPSTTSVSLTVLRHDFAVLTGNRPRVVSGATRGEAAGVRIPVDQLDGLGPELRRQEAAAEAQARSALAKLGPGVLARKMRDIDSGMPAATVDRQRRDAHRRAGARQAASASRVAMNGGRSTTWTAGEHDGLTVGYIRVSLTGTPCGWCAMLLSRGAVYRSARTAQNRYSDGDTYHDHCHCIAEPIWTSADAASDRYALNRTYQVLWPTVTKGKSGKAAVSAWRSYIRHQQRKAPEA